MKEWILICNNSVFDIKRAFEKENTVTWTLCEGMSVGDIVYFYVTDPYRAILYKCKVTNVDLLKMDESAKECVKHIMFYERQQNYMRLELVRSYPEGLITDKEIKSYGINNLQMVSKVPDAFAAFIQEKTEMIKKKDEQKSGKKIFVLVAVVGIIVGVFSFVCSNFLKVPSNEENPTEYIAEEKESKETLEDNNIATEIIEDYQVVSDDLMCNPATLANYGSNLDTTKWSFYQSEKNSEFSFFYPAKLYNHVEISENIQNDIAGTIVEDIKFSASDNFSVANFQLVEKNKNQTIAECVQLLYDYYATNLPGFVKLAYNDGTEGRPGRIIVTGYTDASQKAMTYLMIKVDENYCMRMKIDFPTDGDRETEDFMQKSYVVECFYRMCGFTSSSYYERTYQQFLDGENGDGVKNNISYVPITVKSEMMQYKDMTYSQFKQKTGGECSPVRHEICLGEIPNTTMEICFLASKFDWENWYQLQDSDTCYRLQGTVEDLLDGVAEEQSIDTLLMGLSQGELMPKYTVEEGYAGMQTISDKYLVIAFDSNGDEKRDAELHVDIMGGNLIELSSMAWLVFDMQNEKVMKTEY